MLGYRIDLDFSNHKLPIEIDEDDHSHSNIDYEIKRQKAVEQELGCKYIRIAQRYVNGWLSKGSHYNSKLVLVRVLEYHS